MLALSLAAVFFLIAGLVPTAAAAGALEDDLASFSEELAPDLDGEENPTDPEPMLESVPTLTLSVAPARPRRTPLPDPSHDSLRADDGASRLVERPPAMR